jgi:hypothetical protein
MLVKALAEHGARRRRTMSDHVAKVPTAVLANSRERASGRSKYFLGVALVLLVFVLTGFGPTLFARPFFDVPPLPWYLFVHGFVLASWFLLLVAQTTLVVAHRTDLHRRLGILGGFIAVALVGMSLVAVLGFPAHVKANVLTSNVAFDATVLRTIVWTDLASLVIFSTFVAIALYWRRHSDVHKRLLLLASMAIVGPAVARILPLLSSGPGPLTAAVQGSILIGLPLTLVLHDLVAMRRVHRATVVGATTQLVLIFGALAIANSDVGAALIAALE